MVATRPLLSEPTSSKLAGMVYRLSLPATPRKPRTAAGGPGIFIALAPIARRGQSRQGRYRTGSRIKDPAIRKSFMILIGRRSTSTDYGDCRDRADYLMNAGYQT